MRENCRGLRYILAVALVPAMVIGWAPSFSHASEGDWHVGLARVCITPEELTQVTIYDIKKSDGTPLRLEDVSDVAWVHQPLIGDAVINDGPGLLLIVEKFPWGNTLDVTRGVEEAMAELAPGLEGIEIDTTIFRPATFVELAMNNLGKALAFSAILVVLVLFAFLWEWRLALISVLIIPFAMMAALTSFISIRLMSTKATSGSIP